MLTVCNSRYYALLKNLKQGSSPPLLSFAFLSTLEYFHTSHSEDCEKGCGSWTALQSCLQITTMN